jgi:hypothetical protein
MCVRVRVRVRVRVHGSFFVDVALSWITFPFWALLQWLPSAMRMSYIRSLPTPLQVWCVLPHMVSVVSTPTPWVTAHPLPPTSTKLCAHPQRVHLHPSRLPPLPPPPANRCWLSPPSPMACCGPPGVWAQLWSGSVAGSAARRALELCWQA